MCEFIVMTLNMGTNVPEQTVKTLIDQTAHQEQSDQGLHCLPFHKKSVYRKILNIGTCMSEQTV